MTLKLIISPTNYLATMSELYPDPELKSVGSKQVLDHNLFLSGSATGHGFQVSPSRVQLGRHTQKFNVEEPLVLHDPLRFLKHKMRLSNAHPCSQLEY